jgi:hypothetical protein
MGDNGVAIVLVFLSFVVTFLVPLYALAALF